MVETKKTLTFSKVRVGIFVLFGLAVLAFLILNSTGDFNPFEKKLSLKARFAAADGLREGSEVQLAGVRIGKVERVDLLPPDSPEEFKVEATMAIDGELNGRPISERVRTDSIAQLIATSLLANDKTINITPGTSKGAPVSENDILKSGTAISINQLTRTGNELLEQINKLSVPANEILDKANRGEGTLGRFVNDESLYRNLDATVAETKLTMAKLQTTLEKVNNGDGTAGKLLNDPALYNSLNRTVTQLEGISNDIRSGRGTAGKLITDDALYNETRAAIIDLRTSAAKINGIADDFKLITTDLAEGRGSAGKFLKDEQLYDEARNTMARFNSTAARIEAIITDAQAGKGTIGKLFTDETLYNNVNQTASNVNQLSSEGTKLIYDFRQNPKKYLRIKVSLF
ncbi:MAG: MlaD family protein [Pyrinomonadaceae bacterium]|nr:MCE family protein [Blastocatellia bacterium]MDQ3220071.1 MlaD family protein [Acidobacteriota bacterium]MDQ3489468.1 MlaD family protein [Acidobacteriota bacterium]